MKYRNKFIALLLMTSIIVSVNFIDNNYVYAAGEVRQLKDIPIDNIVYDASSNWSWEDSYGFIVKTAPVEWLVVKNGHFNINATVLVSKDCVALYNYDSSNSNVWSSSSLRTWLRGTFYNHLSTNFKNNIVDVTTYSEGAKSTDNIFILSQVELGGGTSNITGNHGSAIEYFNSDTKRKAQAYCRSSSLQDWYYWTRSPGSDHSSSVRYVDGGGSFYYYDYASSQNFGVRPALNLKSKIYVENIGTNKWKILWNQNPTITLTSPTSNSSLNSSQSMFKGVV